MQDAQAASKGKGSVETAPAPVSQPAKSPMKPSVTKPAAAPAKQVMLLCLVLNCGGCIP